MIEGTAAWSRVTAFLPSASFLLFAHHFQTFKVFLTQVESGWLFELNGRWLEADDPRVIAMKEQTSLRSSPAFSSVTGGLDPPLPV